MEQSGSVLVVDADVDARVSSAAALRSAGYQVIEAGGCREAIGIASRRPVDLALLEVDLPDGDGYRLAHRLRATDDSAVVFLSTVDRVEEILAGFDAGADDYILKTRSRRELLARVAAVLRRAHAAAQVWSVGDLVVDEHSAVVTRRLGCRVDRDRVSPVGGLCAPRGHHVIEAAAARRGVGR
jgi:DNA-binding response OmpR family regulator